MPVLNVIDLEMNQPSGKIIQIGGVHLDTNTGKISNRISMLVDPSEPIAPRITELTDINDDAVTAHGISLEEASSALFTWSSGKRFAAWGDDVPYLKRKLNEAEVSYPRGISSLDISSAWEIFLMTSNGNRKRGLRRAIDKLGMTFMGAQHDAMWDAYNAARVGAYLFSINQQVHKIQAAVGIAPKPRGETKGRIC